MGVFVLTLLKIAATVCSFVNFGYGFESHVFRTRRQFPMAQGSASPSQEVTVLDEVHAPVVPAAAPAVVETAHIMDSVVSPQGEVAIGQTVMANGAPSAVTVLDEVHVVAPPAAAPAVVETAQVMDSVLTPQGEIPIGETMMADEGISVGSTTSEPVLMKNVSLVENATTSVAGSRIETFLHATTTASSALEITKDTNVTKDILNLTKTDNDSVTNNAIVSPLSVDEADTPVLSSRENTEIHEIVRKHLSVSTKNKTESTSQEDSSENSSMEDGGASKSGQKPVGSGGASDEEPPVTKEKLDLAARLFMAASVNTTLPSSIKSTPHANFRGKEQFQ